MISSDCSLAVLPPGFERALDELDLQAEIGGQQVFEECVVQAEEPAARVQILKLQAETELKLIGS